LVWASLTALAIVGFSAPVLVSPVGSPAQMLAFALSLFGWGLAFVWVAQRTVRRSEPATVAASEDRRLMAVLQSMGLQWAGTSTSAALDLWVQCNAGRLSVVRPGLGEPLSLRWRPERADHPGGQRLADWVGEDSGQAGEATQRDGGEVDVSVVLSRTPQRADLASLVVDGLLAVSPELDPMESEEASISWTWAAQLERPWKAQSLLRVVALWGFCALGLMGIGARIGLTQMGRSYEGNVLVTDYYFSWGAALAGIAFLVSVVVLIWQGRGGLRGAVLPAPVQVGVDASGLSFDGARISWRALCAAVPVYFEADGETCLALDLRAGTARVVLGAIVPPQDVPPGAENLVVEYTEVPAGALFWLLRLRARATRRGLGA
jgi:hypothetical protein